MTPAPITNILSGTFERLRAPVLDTIYCSSKGRPGKAIGSEPVAMMIFLAEIDSY